MVVDVETSIADLLSQTSSLEAELDRWRAERAAYEARISARERLIAALRSEAELRDTRLFELPPAAVEHSANGANGNGKTNGHGKGSLGTNDAIIVVLEAAEAALTSDEVWVELERRGWAPLDAAKPRNALRTALWSLAAKGKIEKLGTSRSERRWAAKPLNGSTQAGGP
jgi:hypothetical protein